MEKHKETKVLYISRLAFYPIHWSAFDFIRKNYSVTCTVIGQVQPDIPEVHQQLGVIDPSQNKDIDIRYFPKGRNRQLFLWLFRQLKDIMPDAIWVQEEPDSLILLSILFYYFFNRRIQIISAVCENTFGEIPILQKYLRIILWTRINGLLGVSRFSIDGVRKVGMPRFVPSFTLVSGALPPPKQILPIATPIQINEGDFVIAFAGRICEEKGWKVLLSAIERLPNNFKCLIAGDGPQVTQLNTWLTKNEIKNRVGYFGLLPHDKLMSMYSVAHCLVLPSLTTKKWKEQFGGVLADGMSMGMPLIGSESGAIPEVIGPAGKVFPEGDPIKLAEAIEEIYLNTKLHQELQKISKTRYEKEFSIPSYAMKIASSLKLELREFSS
jgi:glycosyltransferase involved in cell wall biosynthesis